MRGNRPLFARARARVAYLTDVCRGKDHIQDAGPAGDHACGDGVGQRYHQEPQVADGKSNTRINVDLQPDRTCSRGVREKRPKSPKSP